MIFFYFLNMVVPFRHIFFYCWQRCRFRGMLFIYRLLLLLFLWRWCWWWWWGWYLLNILLSYLLYRRKMLASIPYHQVFEHSCDTLYSVLLRMVDRLFLLYFDSFWLIYCWKIRFFDLLLLLLPKIIASTKYWLWKTHGCWALVFWRKNILRWLWVRGTWGKFV